MSYTLKHIQKIREISDLFTEDNGHHWETVEELDKWITTTPKGKEARKIWDSKS